MRILWTKLIKKVFVVIFQVPAEVCKLCSTRSHEVFMEIASMAIEDPDKKVSYKVLPIKGLADNQLIYSGKSKVAIVLQGPLMAKDNFTINAVEQYLSMYPDCWIIVSTWKMQDTEIIDKLEKIGAIVVLSDMPDSAGNLNVNYQIVNSRAGIIKAKELGAKYICKTRTDQLLCRPHLFDNLIGMLEMFPVETNNFSKQRLVCLSMNYGNLFYPYFMSDFFYFGDVDEMIRLFDCPLDTRERFTMDKDSTRRDYSVLMYAPEVYLLRNYFESLGIKTECTVKQYWESVKKYLICIDNQYIDLYWPKYDNYRYRLHNLYGSYFESDSELRKKTENFNFVNWLNLYTGKLTYCKDYEAYADIKFK